MSLIVDTESCRGLTSRDGEESGVKSKPDGPKQKPRPMMGCFFVALD